MERKPAPLVEGSHSPFEKFLWGALIISLSFTDFCFFGETLGNFGALSTFIILFLWIALLPRIIRGEFRFGIKEGSVRLLGLFVLICALSILLSAQAPTAVWSARSPWSLGVREFIQLVWGVSIVFLTIHFIRTWKDFRSALQCCFIGFIFATCAGILETYNFYYGNNVTFEIQKFLNTFGHVASYFSALRLSLLSPEPSMAANYLLCFMPFLLFRAYYWKSSRWSVYFAALSGLLLLGTFSVGGITTFVCQVLIALFILQHRALGKILLATALPVILLLVTYPRPGQVFIERLRDIASSPGGYASANSVRGRTAQVETAYNTFLDHPILGVGIGNEVFYVLEEVPDWATRDPVVSSWIVSNIRTPGAMAANNLIVQIFAETGIAGGLIFVLFLVSILRDCFRLFISAKEPWKKAVYVSILLALAGQIIHYMGMGGWYFRYWFFVWGLAISAKYLNSQTDPRFLRSPNVSRRPSVAPVKNLTGRMGVGEQKRWIRQL